MMKSAEDAISKIPILKCEGRLCSVVKVIRHLNGTKIRRAFTYTAPIALDAAVVDGKKPMPLLAENVVINNQHIKPISPRTLLMWLNKFEKSNYRGFEENSRGTHKNDAFVYE